MIGTSGRLTHRGRRALPMTLLVVALPVLFAATGGSASITDAVTAAVPVVGLLALMVWAMIVFHGDSRWLRRSEAVGPDGNVRWSTAAEHTTLNALVMGQNDKIADHEAKIQVAAEQRAMLQEIRDSVKETSDRVIRLEERLEERSRRP